MMRGYRRDGEERKKDMSFNPAAFNWTKTVQLLSICWERFTECSLSFFLSLSLCVPHTHTHTHTHTWLWAQIGRVVNREKSVAEWNKTDVNKPDNRCLRDKGRKRSGLQCFLFFFSFPFQFYSYRAGWASSYPEQQPLYSHGDLFQGRTRWIMSDSNQGHCGMNQVWRPWQVTFAIQPPLLSKSTWAVLLHMFLHTITKVSHADVHESTTENSPQQIHHLTFYIFNKPFC